MENPYYDYYLNQAGNGISVYAGNRYQNGNGFFGKILKHLKPALKYIGRKGFDTLKNIGSDILNGKDVINSGRERLINTAQDIMTDASNSLENLKGQSGRGAKRKQSVSRSVSRKSPAKRKKTTKKLYKRTKPKKKRKKVSDFS